MLCVGESTLQALIQQVSGDRISYGFAECSLRKKKRISSFYSKSRLRISLFSSIYFFIASHKALWYGFFSYFATAIALNLKCMSSGIVVVVLIFLCVMLYDYVTPLLYTLFLLYDPMQKNIYDKVHRIPCRRKDQTTTHQNPKNPIWGR